MKNDHPNNLKRGKELVDQNSSKVNQPSTNIVEKRKTISTRIVQRRTKQIRETPVSKR